MKKVSGKSPRLRLDANSYRELHRQVLERDGWRCQVCGSMQNLQVHHLKFRSRSGGDVEQNLITLCGECHARIHSKG
jgi:5-methylcytosine-specific restriction endonuclease McrA